jgi:hypothetical protein
MALIVVGVSTLTVIELVTPSRTKTNAPDPFDQLTVDVSVSPDTLEAADRIEIHDLQREAPLQPASPVEPTLPPDVTTLVSGDSSTVGLGINDKRAWSESKNLSRSIQIILTNFGLSAQTPTELERLNDQRRSSSSSRVVPDALDSLLQALKLSSRCQT